MASGRAWLLCMHDPCHVTACITSLLIAKSYCIAYRVVVDELWAVRYFGYWMTFIGLCVKDLVARVLCWEVLWILEGTLWRSLGHWGLWNLCSAAPSPPLLSSISAETKKWLYLITDGSSTPAKGSLSLSQGIVSGIFLWWQKPDGPFLVFVAYG